VFQKNDLDHSYNKPGKIREARWRTHSHRWPRIRGIAHGLVTRTTVNGIGVIPTRSFLSGVNEVRDENPAPTQW
jgi:hypothetical protein